MAFKKAIKINANYCQHEIIYIYIESGRRGILISGNPRKK
jgi:hypothetical protein